MKTINCEQMSPNEILNLVEIGDHVELYNHESGQVTSKESVYVRLNHKPFEVHILNIKQIKKANN